MSLTKFNEIKCPCGETVNVELISSVNASQNPEIKESILGGTFNIVKCENCFELFYAETFVLYIDLEQEIVAFIHPEAEEQNRALLEEKMMADFQTASGNLDGKNKIDLKPMLFFGMDSFVKFLKTEEETEDEAEILKYICRENKFGITALRKSAARKSNLPALLPKICPPDSVNHNLKSEILAGLNEVINICPGLSSYQNALRLILNDPSINIEEKIIA